MINYFSLFKAKHQHQAVLFFVLGLLFLIVRRQVLDSTWVPMGADWDSWLQGAVSLRFGGSYPMVRWPLYGFMVAIVDFVLPTPLHISAQILSMASMAGAAAGVYWLTRRIFSSILWGGVGWFFCLGFPLNLCFAEWCSSYALWGCSCVWTIVGIYEYRKTERVLWAFVAGLGSAFSLAIMAKGLALGVFFSSFSILVILISKKRILKALGAFVLPIFILYSAYALFPHDLKSLDAHIASVDFARSRPLQDKHIYDPTQDPHAYASKGYIFGQSMAPSTVITALENSARSVSSEQREKNLSRSVQIIQTAFPSLSKPILLYLGLSLCGLLLLCRRGWIVWCGVGGIILSTIPSLFVEFNMRFLIPATSVFAVLFVSPLAYLSARFSHFGTATGLSLALGLWLFSPCRDHQATSDWLNALLVPGKRGIWMESQIPPGTVHVVAPPTIGVPISGSRGGHLIVPGSSRLDQPFSVPKDDMVLLWVDFPGWAEVDDVFEISPMMPPFPEGLSQLEGRKVLKHYPVFKTGAGTALLGPLLSNDQ